MTKYPSHYHNAEIEKFIVDFYTANDTKPPGETSDEKDPYALKFAPDGVFKLGPNLSEGYDQIATTRKSMWTKIISRHHVVDRVHPISASDDDVQDMFLSGTVEYGLINGRNLTVDWAGHMIFAPRSATTEYLLHRYQVYVDLAPVDMALAEEA